MERQHVGSGFALPVNFGGCGKHPRSAAPAARSAGIGSEERRAQGMTHRIRPREIEVHCDRATRSQTYDAHQGPRQIRDSLYRSTPAYWLLSCPPVGSHGSQLLSQM